MIASIAVSTSAELQTALKNATGGETILLAAGNYGLLDLINGKTKFDVTHSAAAPVTIRSADPNAPAVFTGLDMRNASGFVFENVTFDYTYKSTDSLWTNRFALTSCADITMRGCTFDGDVAVNRSPADDGLGFGIGLTASNCDNFLFENNEVFDFYRGVTFGQNNNLTVRGNDVHSIRMDGMNFSAAQGVLIENNHFHDFTRSTSTGDHSDMLQFWTNGTTRPSTDIVIRGNVLDIGTGGNTQSIFMRNEEVDTGRAGVEMYYQNVLIEENTIYNDHQHGITVGASAGLTIRNNSVLHTNGADEGPTGNVSVPQISVAAISTGVTIIDNIAGAVSGSGGRGGTPPGWVVENNLILQDDDPALPNHRDATFISSTLDAPGGVHGFVALPGGAIEMTGMGSSATRYAQALASDEAYFNVSEDPTNGAMKIFDATFMADIIGAAADQLADYRWDFGCGHTASGKKVAHAYAARDGGFYTVTLTVELANGETRTGDARVGVQGELLVDFDGASGTFRSHDYGLSHVITAPKVLDGTAIQLGGTGSVATIPIDQLMDVRGSDDFDIDFSIRADTVGASGELFRQHLAYVASIGGGGELTVQFVSQGGVTTKLVTTGAHLNDGLEHNLDIHFRHGQATLWVDGVQNTSALLPGPLNSAASSNLVFGNPWGSKNFAGDMTHFEIRSHVGEFPETPEVADVVILVPDNVVGTGMHDAGWTGKVFDLAAVTTVLKDNAFVTTGTGGPVLHLDGNKDYAALGRQTQFEQSDRIGFSVDFKRDTFDSTVDRLIWNHMKLGLSVTKTGLMVEVATTDQGFKSFTASNLGLDDFELHRAQVMVDMVDDRLQVVLDGEVVIDAGGADFELDQASLREGGWTIGTPWNRFYDGEVHDFRLGDEFHFL